MPEPIPLNASTYPTIEEFVEYIKKCLLHEYSKGRSVYYIRENHWERTPTGDEKEPHDAKLVGISWTIGIGSAAHEFHKRELQNQSGQVAPISLQQSSPTEEDIGQT